MNSDESSGTTEYSSEETRNYMISLKPVEEILNNFFKKRKEIMFKNSNEAVVR